jgi:hypothetical protein
MYYCAPHSKRLEEDVFVTKFDVVDASADKVHHMMVFVCPHETNTLPKW